MPSEIWLLSCMMKSFDDFSKNWVFKPKIQRKYSSSEWNLHRRTWSFQSYWSFLDSPKSLERFLWNRGLVLKVPIASLLLFQMIRVQVNLCQKLLFLHQLTHNMTTYCSLNCKFNTYMKIPSSEHGENMLCTEIDFDIQNNLCSQHVLHMFWKNKSFWQRFTCTIGKLDHPCKPEQCVNHPSPKIKNYGR